MEVNQCSLDLDFVYMNIWILECGSCSLLFTDNMVLLMKLKFSPKKKKMKLNM